MIHIQYFSPGEHFRTLCPNKEFIVNRTYGRLLPWLNTTKIKHNLWNQHLRNILVLVNTFTHCFQTTNSSSIGRVADFCRV